MGILDRGMGYRRQVDVIVQAAKVHESAHRNTEPCGYPYDSCDECAPWARRALEAKAAMPQSYRWSVLAAARTAQAWDWLLGRR